MLYDKKWDKQNPIQYSSLMRGAADALRQYGHCKWALRDKEGRMCLIGALNFVTTSINMKCSAYEALNRHLGCDVIDWNNAAERTPEEAINLFETVATKIEQKEIVPISR